MAGADYYGNRKKLRESDHEIQVILGQYISERGLQHPRHPGHLHGRRTLPQGRLGQQHDFGGSNECRKACETAHIVCYKTEKTNFGGQNGCWKEQKTRRPSRFRTGTYTKRECLARSGHAAPVGHNIGWAAEQATATSWSKAARVRDMDAAAGTGNRPDWTLDRLLLHWAQSTEKHSSFTRETRKLHHFITNDSYWLCLLQGCACTRHHVPLHPLKIVQAVCSRVRDLPYLKQQSSQCSGDHSIGVKVSVNAFVYIVQNQWMCIKTCFYVNRLLLHFNIR